MLEGVHGRLGEQGVGEEEDLLPALEGGFKVARGQGVVSLVVDRNKGELALVAGSRRQDQGEELVSEVGKQGSTLSTKGLAC